MECSTTNVISLIGAGPVCSGHGTCLIISNSSSVCVCESLWTGRADIVTLDTLACQNPIILDRLVWGLASLAWVIMWFRSLPIAYSVIHHAKSGRAAHLTVGFQCAVAIPLMCAALLLRTATGLNIGVDLSITLLFALAQVVSFVSAWKIHFDIFAMLLRGASSIGESRAVDGIIRKAWICGIFFNFMQTIFLGFVPLAGCFIPITDTDGRISLLVIRNVGTVLYFAMFLVLDYFQLGAIRKLAAGTSKESPQFIATLDKFEANMKSSASRIVALSVVFLAFVVIPPLYPFAYVGWAAILALTAGPNYAIFTFRAVDGPQSSSSPDPARSDPKSSVQNVVSSVGPAAVVTSTVD